MIELTRFKQPELLIRELSVPLKNFTNIKEDNQKEFIRIFNTYKDVLPVEIQDHPILYKKFYYKLLWIIPIQLELQIVLTRTSLIVDCKDVKKIHVFNIEKLHIDSDEKKTTIKGLNIATGKFDQVTIEQGKLELLGNIVVAINELIEMGEWLVESTPFIQNWKTEASLIHQNEIEESREEAFLLGRNAIYGSSKINADRVKELKVDCIATRFPNISKALEISYQQGFELALEELKSEVEYNGEKCFEEYKDPEEVFQEYVATINANVLDLIESRVVKEWFFDGYDEQIEMLGEESYELGYQHGYKGYYNSCYIIQFKNLINDLKKQPRCKTLISLMNAEFDHGFEVGTRERNEEEQERKRREAEWEKEDMEYNRKREKMDEE